MTDATRDATRPGPQALSAAISAVLSVASGAASRAGTAHRTVTGLGEVIVTATKRAESLQDVSESISAFDTKSIEMRGLQQIDDIAKYIPGLSLAQREPAGTTIVFRGVAASGLQFGAVSSSALYLDEQPITQSGRSPDPRFIDIERIEALRGPQGTLYGASSQSGTLRVITNKPDPSRLRRLGRGRDQQRVGRLGRLRRQRHGQPAAGERPHRAAPRRIHDGGRRLHRQRALGQPRRHVRQRGQRREGRQQHPDDRRARGAAVRHFGERGPHRSARSTRTSTPTGTPT